jgi:hypothetical protein
MESYAFGQLVQLEKQQQLQLRTSRRRMANGEGQIVVFTAAKADPKKKVADVPEAPPKKLSLGQVWCFRVIACCQGSCASASRSALPRRYASRLM